MLVGQWPQIPTGTLSGVRHLAYESPQHRTHCKKHATTPITLKRLANLNLSCALFFSTHARQTASSIWGSLSACNMNFVLTQTRLVYSQIERDGLPYNSPILVK